MDAFRCLCETWWNSSDCGNYCGNCSWKYRRSDKKPVAGPIDCVFHNSRNGDAILRAGNPVVASLLLKAWLGAGIQFRNPNYVLPFIALSVYPMAYITRLTKTSMLDALNQDYIRTANAKGVARWKVIFKHALRNALIPVITYVGPMVAYILTGSMVVESIFTIGGLGSSFVTSITNRDYTTIMATTIFLAVLMVIANLLTDIAYKLVDPRITLE